MPRRLSPEEAALWAQVRASVTPLRRPPPAPVPAPAPTRAAPASKAPVRPPPGPAKPPAAPRAAPAPRRQAPGETLDGGWDRRLTRGIVSPDMTIDLHGHTLRSAHDLLDAALDRAIRHGDRVILLVTGKPPRPESERPHARGVIRAAIGDWLAGSRHAPRIAAVRGAHPRHGGTGALYVILRRVREG